jgi:uncharacterized protein (DUF433 family)
MITSAMSIELDSLLIHSPDMRHDRVRIAGTGITVHRIAILSNLGHSPEEIVRKYKHLTLAGVHAALAYYHANRAQIDAEIAADQAEAARLEAEFARAPQVA